MKVYPPEHIRNVALVGPPGAGKTTLAEAMLYRAGVIDRIGRVEDGNTVTDYEPEEKEATSSQSLALAAFEWNDHKINLLDVPGSSDFAGELHSALVAADMLVLVVDASSGVDYHTVNAWREAAKLDLPRMVFVNKLDKEHTSFEPVLDSLRETFGAGVAPLELPIGEAEGFHGIADLLDDEAWFYDSGQAEKGTVPDDVKAREAEVREALIEGIVVADDELLEQYLEGEVPDPGRLGKVLGEGVASGTVFPVVCGSAIGPIAVDRLCNYLVEIGSSPLDRPPAVVHAGDASVEVACDPNGDALAYVFKTINDQFVGQLSLFKMRSGTVKRDDTLTNARTSNDERLRSVVTMRGGETLDVDSVPAGDIAAAPKLTETRTGDTLTGAGRTVTVEAPGWPEPMLAIAIKPHSRADEDKLGIALRKLQDEDPTLEIVRNEETHQMLLTGMGDNHLRVTRQRLVRKFGVQVDTEEVLVPYRQTVTATAEAEGKHKKQTGGHGQFGVAWVRLEPLPRGSGYEFVDAITGGVIPRQYIPAVDAGIQEAMGSAGDHGFPVVDIRATVYDGKHHSVDSSEMSFKMAGRLAFNAAFESARPVVLEPMASVEVIVPAEYQGDVMGDLSSRRGQVQGTDTNDWGEQVIRALVPEAEIVTYAIDLRSMTGGRGQFHAKRDHYEVASGPIKLPATKDDE